MNVYMRKKSKIPIIYTNNSRYFETKNSHSMALQSMAFNLKRKIPNMKLTNKTSINNPNIHLIVHEIEDLAKEEFLKTTHFSHVDIGYLDEKNIKL